MHDPVRVKELATLAEIGFPRDATLRAEDDGGRPDSGYHLWVIHSGTSFDLPKGGEFAVPVESSLRVLEGSLAGIKPGKASGPEARARDWKNGNGTWRSTVLGTETGFYLMLERFQQEKE